MCLTTCISEHKSKWTLNLKVPTITGAGVTGHDLLGKLLKKGIAS